MSKKHIAVVHFRGDATYADVELILDKLESLHYQIEEKPKEGRIRLAVEVSEDE